MSLRTGPPFPWVCLVTDHTVCPGGLAGLERAIAAALEGGVNMVQLREKSISPLELYQLARRVKKLTSDAGARLVINDRVDVAAAVDADGAQLGEGGIPVAAARLLLGDRLIGRSVHNLPEALLAQVTGADYLVLGTIFPSGSHPGGASAGPRLIRQARSRLGGIPILAIGGINADNVSSVMAEGASGIAVTRTVLADPSPREAAERLVSTVLADWSAPTSEPTPAAVTETALEQLQLIAVREPDAESD